MSKWMQVAAVALAAVVGLVPVFGQIAPQAASETVPVVPMGKELVDEELVDIEGAFVSVREFAIGAVLGIETGFTASQSGASLELSITIGFLTFGGYLAGIWPRSPKSPPGLLLMLLDPLWELRINGRLTYY